MISPSRHSDISVVKEFDQGRREHHLVRGGGGGGGINIEGTFLEKKGVRHVLLYAAKTVKPSAKRHKLISDISANKSALFRFYFKTKSFLAHSNVNFTKG